MEWFHGSLNSFLHVPHEKEKRQRRFSDLKKKYLRHCICQNVSLGDRVCETHDLFDSKGSEISVDRSNIILLLKGLSLSLFQRIWRDPLFYSTFFLNIRWDFPSLLKSLFDCKRQKRLFAFEQSRDRLVAPKPRLSLDTIQAGDISCDQARVVGTFL